MKEYKPVCANCRYYVSIVKPEGRVFVCGNTASFMKWREVDRSFSCYRHEIIEKINNSMKQDIPDELEFNFKLSGQGAKLYYFVSNVWRPICL